MTVSPLLNLSPHFPAAVIAVNCELVRGSETQVLEELLPRVKRESIALDLAQVERIDAAGIAALITLYCQSVEAGTVFCVVNPSSHVLELLRLVGLESILVAADRQPEASRMHLDACRCAA